MYTLYLQVNILIIVSLRIQIWHTTVNLLSKIKFLFKHNLVWDVF